MDEESGKLKYLMGGLAVGIRQLVVIRMCTEVPVLSYFVRQLMKRLSENPVGDGVVYGVD